MPERMITAVWRTNRTLPLLIAALLLLNLLLLLVGTRVVTPRVETLERRYIERQAQIRQALHRQEQLATPQERFQRNAGDLETFWAAIPPRSEFTALIQEVFSLAEDADLGIDRISYEPRVESERNLLRYALSFSVSGNYSQIKRFIYSLEQSSRIIALEELALSGRESSEGDAVSLRIRLSTYFKTLNT